MATVKQLLEHYHRMNADAVDKKSEIITRELQSWVEEATGAHADQSLPALKQTQSTLLHHLQLFQSTYTNIKDQILVEVDQIDSDYYTRSSQLFNEGRRDSAQYILDRQSKNSLLNTDALNVFVQRMNHHVNWQWPAMEIRPGKGQLSRYLVGCDPLYLVDTDAELLVPSTQQWTEEYKRRVRTYVINEFDAHIFKELPHNQFGLIVASDFFHYRSMEMIEKYLKDMLSILRPGGVIMIAYNNCDLPNAIDLCDNMFYCYTPGRKVRHLLEHFGYEILASADINLNTSWIEAKKPGTLSSIRGSQTLGKVVNI